MVACIRYIPLSAAVAVMAVIAPAHGHDFYDVVCCANRDCHPIPSTDVEATRDGWRIRITGEIIPYNAWFLKRSPDGSFHRCAAFNNFGPKGRTKCLYVPDMGE